MSDTPISNNRSTLKEFLASIATIQGDLSNITAPPFVLAEHSTVELPQYWADHPSLFVAPALAESPEERALRVLKWFLGSLKNQQYAGRDPSEGVKKPLNAFLGELFLGSWKDKEAGETKLVSEQVSHHPPVTACYLWNEKHGISADGFTCQEITFSGSVKIKQKGYAIMHVDTYDEDYLIPVPNVKVSGILSGTPYPELQGKYSIVSSSGFVSEIKFEGKGLFSGTKNRVEARVFHIDDPSTDIYTVHGSWAERFTIKDAKAKKEMDTHSIDDEPSARLNVSGVSEQDPWESRRAWKDVREALTKGDMQLTSEAKSIIEEGQRNLRKEEKARGGEWERIFYRRVHSDDLFQKLSAMSNDCYDVDVNGGIWKANKDAIENAKRPYHGDLEPTGGRIHATGTIKESDGIFNGISDSVGAYNQPTAFKSQQDITPSPVNRKDTALDTDEPEQIQIEELLRAKYSSRGS
jgi:hypothetical protein